MSRWDEWRAVALAHPCFLGGETVHPRFAHPLGRGYSLVLTVNAGYE